MQGCRIQISTNFVDYCTFWNIVSAGKTWIHEAVQRTFNECCTFRVIQLINNGICCSIEYNHSYLRHLCLRVSHDQKLLTWQYLICYLLLPSEVKGHFLGQADLHHSRLQSVQRNVHKLRIVWPWRCQTFCSLPLLAAVQERVELVAHDLSLAHWAVPGTVYCQNLTARSNKENSLFVSCLSNGIW